MNAAFAITNDLNLLPSFIAGTKLLRYFSNEASAIIVEKESRSENGNYFFAQAQSHKLAGFGRGVTKRLAFVKAIAEFYERRLMFEAFSNELSFVPKVLQTSNGFAVHFSQDQAIRAATNESVERHLLQYSFLKDGWSGFELIEEKNMGDETVTFVASRYEINGLRAGMVLARSARFPGISFGYFAEESNKIKSSPRWSHAISEALDKIDPFLKLAQAVSSVEYSPIEQGILNWMMMSHEKINFSKGGVIQTLPTSTFDINCFNLAERWNLDFPFYGAYCFSPNLLPLLIVDRIKQPDLKYVSEVLKKFNLPSQIPTRNPVL